MAHINPQRLVELLEGLYTLLTLAWELSKNPELTELLENAREKIEDMIRTTNTLIS